MSESSRQPVDGKRPPQAALRSPGPDESLVRILEMVDSSLATAAQQVLATAGIKAEVSKSVRTADNRRQWQPGVRDVSVWSADEQQARTIIDELKSRRERLLRPKRSTDTGSGGSDSSDHLSGLDAGDFGSFTD